MKIESKFGISEKVTHFSGVKGMITAIFIRGDNRAYEFSYVESDGMLARANMQECELAKPNGNSLGFKGNGRKSHE